MYVFYLHKIRIESLNWKKFGPVDTQVERGISQQGKERKKENESKYSFLIWIHAYNRAHKTGENSEATLPSTHVLTNSTRKTRLSFQQTLSILRCEHLQLRTSNVSALMALSYLSHVVKGVVM